MNFSEHLNSDNLKEFEYYSDQIKNFENLNQGIHGINHLLRVLLFTIVIGNALELSGKNKNIICTSAIYHDIGRKNDNNDALHGLLSWRKIKPFIEEEFEKDDLNIIKYVIENHCVPDETARKNIQNYPIEDKTYAQYLLSIVKDADSLDIIRLGFFDKKYLNHEISKKIINFAQYMNRLDSGIQHLDRVLNNY